MSSDADEGSDSDGTSADTILKELCLLRCSNCEEGTRDNSQLTSQLGSVNFSSFCASEVTFTPAPSSIVDAPSLSDNPRSLIYQDRSSVRALSSDSSQHFRERNIFFNELSDSRLFSNPWFKRLQNIVSRSNGSTESCLPCHSHFELESISRASQVDSRCLNSTGTDTPDFESHRITRGVGLALSERSQQTSPRSDSEESNSVDCLLGERCSSPDCACDKRLRNTRKVLRSSRRKANYKGRPRSVASQVTETIHGLKLTGWDGQIIIQEEDLDFNLDPVRDKRAVSRESVLSVFDLCRVSSLSSNQSSDSALTFLKKCSDSNLLNSLGLKQDQGVLRNEIMGSSKENNDGKSGKGQMVETYGKLLHKIEKFKRMTSWKSKKRKNKLKYTLEGAELKEEPLDNCCSGNVKGKKNERVIDMRNIDVDHMSCGDTAGVFAQSKEDSTLVETKRNQPDFKQSVIQEEQKRKTCEIGIQSVHSVKSESFMTTIETSSDQINLQDAKGFSVGDRVQTSSLHISKDMADLKTSCLPNNAVDSKRRRLRPESAISIGTCSLLKDVDKSLSSLGGRETQDEILEHLRQINNLIERESCASNSTHRLCKSERNLGFEANKLAKPKRLTKVDRDSKEITKIRKEGRVYWAVTKVTVYPDSCRTYEVMRLSRRRPQNVPSSSETVFVLLPNK